MFRGFNYLILLLILFLVPVTFAQDPTATPTSGSGTTPMGNQPPNVTRTPDEVLLNPATFFLRQWASDAEATSEYQADQYNARQATGAPDTVYGCGSNPLAWASESPTGKDTLTLTYKTPVLPLQVVVYQSSAPGAITSIELIPAEGGENLVIENSASPVTDCPSIFELSIESVEPIFISGMVIHLDQTLTGTWNEIDAVELVGLTDLAALDFEYTFQWASNAKATSEYTPTDWNALQATGEPNTFSCGDIITAWASATSTGIDSLTVSFDEAVIPVGVNIYQTYNPGAITSVDFLTAESAEMISVPKSADTGGTGCPGWFFVSAAYSDIPLPRVNGAVINLDQTITQSWNEIDAVQLIGATPKVR